MKDFNIDLAHDIAPSECGFYARGDYKEPTLIARRVDGSSMICFRFVNFTKNMNKSQNKTKTKRTTKVDNLAKIKGDFIYESNRNCEKN